MKNKPLLNESTIRKFMKLANLGKVGQGFIAEAYGHEEKEEEEEEEEGDLEENLAKQGGNKHNSFKSMKKQAYKPMKTSKKNIVKEAEEEEAEAVPGDQDAGAETPDMGGAPEVQPAEEPTEMDASSLADQIIQVLQDAGLVDVVEDEPEMDGKEEEDEEEEEEDEGMYDEGTYDEGQYEEEGMYEAKGFGQIRTDIKSPAAKPAAPAAQGAAPAVKQEGALAASNPFKGAKPAPAPAAEEEEEAMLESKKAKFAKVIAERVKARLAKESKIDRLAETITNKVIARARKGR